MNFVRWSFLFTFAAMIDIKDIPDFVAELDPLFSYIHKVSNHFWLYCDPDIQELSFSQVPHTFYKRYLNGAINVERLKKYETCTEIQDTLRAFGIDKEKFWYLCLLIKDYVEGETVNAIVEKPTHREELQLLSSEIGKLNPRKWADIFLTDGEATLTLKVSKHPVTITNGHTLSLLKEAIDSLLEKYSETSTLLDSSPVDLNDTITLADGYRLYLFDKYMSWFLKDLKADKSLTSTDTRNSKVSTDKKLLVSRILFVLGITDDEDYFEEFKEIKKEGENRTKTVKIDKLKNALKNYKDIKVQTNNSFYW